MQTLKLTSKDFKQSDSYYKDYIGKTDVSDFDGNIEIEGGLGYTKFNSLKAKGYILAEAGSGIEAGDGIEAGSGIKAGWGIKAGSGIEAGSGIKAGWGIEAGDGIEAGWGIEAGDGIKAGWGIEAGDGIEAGEGIKAGWGIEAGDGIEAGLTITCKLTLKVAYRIFAGICHWRKNVEDTDKTVTCGKLEGHIEYGILNETGLPEQKVKEDMVEIDGKKWSKETIKEALKNHVG